MFIELMRQDYCRGDYITGLAMFAIDDISRVVECLDDHSLTNVITKDGKIHTITERYENVAKKIRDAERKEE